MTPRTYHEPTADDWVILRLMAALAPQIREGMDDRLWAEYCRSASYLLRRVGAEGFERMTDALDDERRAQRS